MPSLSVSFAIHYEKLFFSAELSLRSKNFFRVTPPSRHVLLCKQLLAMATRQTSMCDSATVPAGRVTRKKVIDFRKLTTIKLPKRRKLAKRATDGRLYDIEVLEKCDGRVKIHYVGYSELYDEWRLESEIAVKSLTVQHDTQGRRRSCVCDCPVCVLTVQGVGSTNQAMLN